jgi:hypothetical protein
MARMNGSNSHELQELHESCSASAVEGGADMLCDFQETCPEADQKFG